MAPGNTSRSRNTRSQKTRSQNTRNTRVPLVDPDEERLEVIESAELSDGNGVEEHDVQDTAQTSVRMAAGSAVDTAHFFKPYLTATRSTDGRKACVVCQYVIYFFILNFFKW